MRVMAMMEMGEWTHR